MKSKRLIWPSLACLLLCAASTVAFNADSFKVCSDSAFCTRLRGKTSQEFVIDPDTLKLEGGKIIAKIRNLENANATFDFILTAYNDGLIRLHIDEPAHVGRYQVPDVLLPGLETREQEWKVVRETSKMVIFRLEPTIQIQLHFHPVSLEIWNSNQPLFTWNGEHHFIFEHRREKQEGDPEGWWEENFKGHADSKSRGPEAISFDVQFHGFNHVYGLPERAGPMSLRPTVNKTKDPISEPYRLYNLDVFEYLDDSPFGLYGSIPLLVGHMEKRTAGVFWLNAAEMYVDIQKPGLGVGTHWIAESGVVDLFFITGPSPVEVATQYASLTGGTALPQMFALGYHQCRWNYRDEEDVRQVDDGFDVHDIPYDVIWLDIEHTDGKKYFTWDANYFPTPQEMLKNISGKGRKMVTIVDPHIKRDISWPLFKLAEDAGLYVKNKDNGDFDGWCWPGSSSYLDMTNPEARSWWADRFSLSNYVGSTTDLYIWNDMNEPSVFNGPEITMPKDNLHFGGYEHRDIHNVYGYFYHMATADGLRRRGFQEQGPDGDRPFVLSRAFFSGTQRIGAIWTGDNAAQWSHLEVSVPMLLTLGVTGLPFSGADIGGFFGNPDAELATRWYQAGIYNPFFRGHAHLETARREPWLFGDEATVRIREAIQQRYKMLPYLYTLFAHANSTGMPIMRPLWWEFTEDVDTYEEDRVFMFGPCILSAPVLSQGATESRVFLPGRDLWYEMSTGTVVDSSVPTNRNLSIPVTMDSMPAYYKGGSIIPLKERTRRSTAAMVTDPLTLIIALNKNGVAKGDLYIDDGRSFAFQRGQYAYRNFEYTSSNVLTSSSGGALPNMAAAHSSYRSGVFIDRIVVLGLKGGPEGWEAQLVGSDGSATPLSVEVGPIVLKEGLPEVALIVRRPRLSVEQDWKIEFSKGPGGAKAVS